MTRIRKRPGLPGGRPARTGPDAYQDTMREYESRRRIERMPDGIILPSTPGKGIRVDVGRPAYPWKDILGEIHAKTTGPTAPSWATYRAPIYQYQFQVNDEVWNEFHMPHDYLPGSDLFLHIHWSHAATTVTGGTVTWTSSISYSKGHNQGAFSAPISVVLTPTASTTQYQHIISEQQFTDGISAAYFPVEDIEPDGVFLVHTTLTANNITVSGGGVPDPFVHYIDIHYQSIGVGTKQKSPNFYADFPNS